MIGAVRELGRFPVKSMLGESPRRVTLDDKGVVGDRTHGLLDVATGKIASAKDPRRWADLLRYRAAWAGEALDITLPDGASLSSTDPDVDARLSAAIGREVRLLATPPAEAVYDYVWDVQHVAPADILESTRTDTTEDGVPVSTMPNAMMAPGTFQDVAPITILTTASLRAMAAVHPDGDWDPARFRANLVLDFEGDDLAENDWAGRRLAVGDAVLEVTFPTPRCVMTTLAQGGLERDRGILRTVADHNKLEFAGLGKWACLGAYASVVEPGSVSVGDAVELR